MSLGEVHRVVEVKLESDSRNPMEIVPVEECASRRLGGDRTNSE